MDAPGSARPTAVQSLCWRSAAQLDGLRTGLLAALDGWGRDWGLAVDGLQVDNAWQAPPVATAWQPLAVGANGRKVAWVGCDAPCVAALEQALFGAQPPAEHGAPALSRSLARDALAALHRSAVDWLGAIAAEQDMPDDGPPAGDSLAWSGAVRAVARFAGPDARPFSVSLHVRAEAWPRPGRGSSVAATALPALSPLHEALVDEPVRLHARLADVPVTLGELVGLREGDVLVTGHRLADPLSLSAHEADATAVFAGRLVQRNGRMAVALVSAR
ncbi:FliM/FliN family flagellar motor switch protein [Ideonella sp. YS5]|uniref:FliM/FliN family flagellar motor switch protein n=1 Tax=Ideonella sp. YS5 TaxID=3453714 RepID=UPI003EEF3E0A